MAGRPDNFSSVMKHILPLAKQFLARRRLRRLALNSANRDEGYHVPVWMGTQLMPFPVFLKGKPPNKRHPRDFYDEWE